MAGANPTRRYLDALRAAAPGAHRTDLAAGVARAVAAARGWDLPPELVPRPTDLGMAEALASVAVPSEVAGPHLLGVALERWTAAPDRRRRGAHFTPAPVAEALVRRAVDLRGGLPDRVLDPACGGGAFLLAAAEVARRAGADPAGIVAGGLWGIDLDAVSVAVTRAALAGWAVEHGGGPVDAGPHLAVADGLGREPWPEQRFDLVVGNPPFLGQLDASTARTAADRVAADARFGDAVRPYTDTAALFLLAAVERAGPGGVVAMVQPASVLAGRDAAGVRARLLAHADLRGLWVAGEPVFDAKVRVAGVVLSAREEGPTAGAADRPPVARWARRDLRPLPSALPPVHADDWSRLALAALGVPEPSLRTAGVVGDLATAHAGFRDHYYELVPHVVEAPQGDLPDHLAPLVTAGLVDPGRCAWGVRPARFAGERWTRPAVDRTSLRRAGGRVARWVEELARPKVVVAPQTRVGEAAVDRDGRWVASVPTVALVAEPADLDRLAAVVCAPPIAALALARSAGTGLADQAIKLSGAQLRALPLPIDHEAWAEGARCLMAGDLPAFGTAMAVAYGLAPDDPVVGWWAARRPA